MGSWYDPLGVTDTFTGKGYKDPAKAAQPYLNQVPETISPYYQPYINAGQGSLNTLQQQYGNLVNNPGQQLNTIGQGYQQSPGYDFQMQQALQAANHAAAAGGMTGSPQNQQQNMQVASDIANQDYYNWLGQALGLYNTGLSGTQDINKMGYGASNELAQSLANNLMSQSGLQYQGAQGQNQHQADTLSAFTGLASAALPLLAF